MTIWNLNIKIIIFKDKIIASGNYDQRLNGYYVTPTIIELNDLKEINEEIFGPVIHIYKYKSQEVEKLINDINQMNYGLTLGVQSRIENTINYIFHNANIGNIYINRNIVGAVVGVQPFGGRGLSGTGPKAGGPSALHGYSDSVLCSDKTSHLISANNEDIKFKNLKLPSLQLSKDVLSIMKKKF